MIQSPSVLQDRDGPSVRYPAMSMSRPSRLDVPPSVTNITPPTTAHAHAHAHAQQEESLPNSQESFLSTSTSDSAAPRIFSSASNISNSTYAETDLTSPPSSNDQTSQKPIVDPIRTAALSSTRAQPPLTSSDAPKLSIDIKNDARIASGIATSPTSADTTSLTHGSKRTASGTVKYAGQENIDSPMRAAVPGHARNTSIDFNASRIGELSAQLKARLSYAMVKVQNGWEKRSIEELEEESQRPSPTASTPITDGSRQPFETPMSQTRRRRQSAVSNNSDHYITSPSLDSPLDRARSLNSTPLSHWRPGPASQGVATSTTAPSTVRILPNASVVPTLAPAADIVSSRKRRSISSRAPPPLLSTSGRKHYSDLGAPRTPTEVPRRAGILRMPSQQAEKDALETLIFMSSPNNSSRMAHTSADAQPSPLRTEMAGVKRVVFEDHPEQDRVPKGRDNVPTYDKR